MSMNHDANKKDEELERMKADLGLWYALGRMMARIYVSMSVAVLQMSSDPRFGTLAMLLLVSLLKLGQML